MLLVNGGNIEAAVLLLSNPALSKLRPLVLLLVWPSCANFESAKQLLQEFIGGKVCRPVFVKMFDMYGLSTFHDETFHIANAFTTVCLS